jgi:uncharacterized protein YdhG (YjbR/CyaY superfamily)
MKAPENVDDYIKGFPPAVQARLKKIRETITVVAPEAVESIGYGMPAYKYEGPLVYFAGYKHHIGFYPTRSGIAAFSRELSKYKSARGSVQFPMDQELPLPLIKKIVQFRLKENKAGARKKPKENAKNKTGK